MGLSFHWWSYLWAVKGASLTEEFNSARFFIPDGIIPARPGDFLILISRLLGGGGNPAEFFSGRFRPGVQPLTRLRTIFDRKGTSFVTYTREGREFDSHLELGIFSELPGIRILLLPNSIDKWYPFHIHSLEQLIPFNIFFNFCIKTHRLFHYMNT